MPPNNSTLQRYAFIISVMSVFYNGAEGAVSIILGADSSSRSLILFGIQSGIETVSSIIVVWRFRRVAMPGNETEAEITASDLRFEKLGTWLIGLLLVALTIATEVSAILGLATHAEPDTSNATLIVSASALVLMVLFWLPKRYLAHALNSSTMKGEATCSLSCIQITIVVFAGALIFKLWKGGWWVDNATTILLGFMFGREAYKTISWVRDPEFNGGCCHDHDDRHPATPTDTEMQVPYKDLCECCNEKDGLDCVVVRENCDCNSGRSGKAIDCCAPPKGCCPEKPVEQIEARKMKGNEDKTCKHEGTSQKQDGCCATGHLIDITSDAEERQITSTQPASGSAGTGVSKDAHDKCCATTPVKPAAVQAKEQTKYTEGASPSTPSGCQSSCCKK